MNRICFYSNQILPIIGIHYEKCQQIAIEAITSQCSSYSRLFFIRFFLHITPNSTRLESIWSRPNIVRGFWYFCYIAAEQINSFTSLSCDEIFSELVLLSRAAIIIILRFLSCAMFVFHRWRHKNSLLFSPEVNLGPKISFFSLNILFWEK